MLSIKSGDRKPHLSATLAGGPSSWTSATCQISIWADTASPTTATRYAATTFNTTTGAVTWDYTGWLTTTAGTYNYEWVVTFSDDDEMSAPGDKFLQLRIVDSSPTP